MTVFEAPIHRGTRCSEEIVRRRLGSGASAIHITSDLVMRIESERDASLLPNDTAEINVAETVRQLDDLLGIENFNKAYELDKKEATLTGHIMSLTFPYSFDDTPINDMDPSEMGYVFPTRYSTNCTNHASTTFNMSPKHIENRM